MKTQLIDIERRAPEPAPEQEDLITLLMSWLRPLQTHWRLAAGATAAGLVVVFLALALAHPVYTSEALLELDFNREEAAQSTTTSRQLASADPGALINDTAQNISSRTTVSSVVTRLHLDDDSKFKHRSILGSLVRAIGIGSPQLPPHELAINELQRNLVVAAKAHFYVVGVDYTDHDPVMAARIANAFVYEYLRGQKLRGLNEKRQVVVQELRNLAGKVGVLHPAYGQVQARIDQIDKQIDAAKKDGEQPSDVLVSGEYMTRAEPVLTPTGPKRLPLLLVGSAVALAMGILAALLTDYFGAALIEEHVRRGLDMLANFSAAVRGWIRSTLHAGSRRKSGS